MFNRSENTSHASESHGAITLLYRLARSLGVEGHDVLIKRINFWQTAMKGEFDSENSSTKEIQEMKRVHDWYRNELKSYSYAAPGWEIRTERALLFQEFRNDPYYHLKNLVEVVMRQVINELLRSQGVEAVVYLTSDSDDVFAKVDMIIEAKTEKGTEYMGMDLAVSENPEYLRNKQQRTMTVCCEFNAYKKLGKREMVRQVFSVSPQTMARFLSECMARVASHGRVDSEEILSLFYEAKNPTAQAVQSSTQSRTREVLH